MAIPVLPPLDRTSPSFAADLDAFFAVNLPATIPAFNAEIERINAIGFGSYSATSTTSLLIGTGNKTLTIEAGKAFSIGQPVMIAASSDPAGAFMSGKVTAYNDVTGSISVNVQDTSSNGLTFSSWAISLSAQVSRIANVGDVYTGVVKPTAGAWLPLNGSVYLQSSYAELFGLLGIVIDNPGAISTITARTLPSAVQWSATAYGNGVYVAIADGPSSSAASSPDGLTWTARTMPSSAEWRAVTYGNGTFVAVATGASSTAAATSPDGVNWTLRTLPSGSAWSGVAYGNGKFVAVANGTGKAATSTDGITWTLQTMPTYPIAGFCFGGTGFVAVSYAGAVSIFSTDGVTWITGALPSTANWQSVTYGNGKYVAIAQSSNKAATSTNGTTWTAQTLPASVVWLSISFGGGVFFATNDTTSAASSLDGITWVSRTIPYSGLCRGASFGVGRFIAVISSTSTAISSASFTTYDATTQFLVPNATLTPGIGQWIKGL